MEYDRVTPDAPTPSPLVCGGGRSHADSAYYTTPSGAGVFSCGTMRWVEALVAGTRENGRNHGLDAFAAGPAAHHRPAPRDNVAQVYGRRAAR